MPEQPASASIADSCSIHDFDELLSLDDIFVEYFNEFLRLGIFIPKIEYNRELNTFTERKSDHLPNLNDEDSLDPNRKQPDEIDTNSIYSGFSDLIHLDNVPDDTTKNNSRLLKIRQVQMMEWTKSERLSLFWRTELYRQYKLCKLLLRPLTTEKEASEYSSQGIGGYSRQSIYTAARTLSTDNSNGIVPTGTLEEEDEEQQDFDQNDAMLNANIIFENSIMASEYLRAPRAFLRPGSRAYSVPANMVSSISIVLPNLQIKYPTKFSKRSSSSKTSQRKSIPKDEENNSSNDLNDPRSVSIFSSAKVRYLEDGDHEEDNDDVGALGLQIQSSSNQLKYKYLGTFKGMQSFVRFLQTTKGGYDLYRFWMDCEFFKDTMAGLDQIENVVARTRLFRDLNDGKYHLPFMRHLQNKIRRAYSDTAGVLTHDVFLQVQYDVLRRLRIYWSARFIIHQLFQQHHTQIHFPIELKRPANVCLYPIDQRTQANLVEMTRVFLSDDYTTNEENQVVEDEIEHSFDSKFMKKYVTIIRQDKQAGGLFLRYITFNERRLLPLMLFSYDVDDFRYSNLDDKILERQHGLSILNTYFGNSAKLSLDHFMPDIQIQKWIDAFHQYKFDKLTFEPLFKRALLILKDAWLRCMTEDIDRYTAAYYLSSPPHSPHDSDEEEEEEADEAEDDRQVLEMEEGGKTVVAEPPPIFATPKKSIERLHSTDTRIKVSDDVIYVKRPWVKRFVPSEPGERQERLIHALDNAMTDEERQRLRAARLERLRKIEENRKKALRAARERQRKKTTGKEGTDTTTSAKTLQARRPNSGFYFDRLLPSKTATLPKDSQRLILGNFQHHIRTSTTVSPKLENKLSLVFETVKWLETTNPYEKQQHLDRMKKTYFDNQSRRSILPLTDQQNAIYTSNNARPDPVLVQTLHRDLRAEIEQEFVHFCEDCLQEYEIDTIDDFLTKSIDELTLLFNESGENAHDEDDLAALLDPDVEALASNSDGTGKATKKHLTELLQLIADAAIGRFNERFYYFYAYLTHWVDQKKAAYLDYDLLFCIDVSRLKEIANDAMLQAKLRYILETYLESTVTSNTLTCRLDLPNNELQMRMLRSIQKSLATNIYDFSVLEEIRTIIVKDKLVYYYAGFKAYLFRMNLSKTHPSRLMRLQEQLNTYQQQQQQAKRSAKTAGRPSVSTANKKLSEAKAESPTSKKHRSAPSTPVNITTITKTQSLLNERMKTFEKLPPNQVTDIPFPNINNKPGRLRSATSKSRHTNSQEGQRTQIEKLNSDKDKNRGPIYVQYTLTSGLKVKYSDGKPVNETDTNGTGIGLQQQRDSIAYSFGSAND